MGHTNPLDTTGRQEAYPLGGFFFIWLRLLKQGHRIEALTWRRDLPYQIAIEVSPPYEGARTLTGTTVHDLLDRVGGHDGWM